jgi:hypothetical protein
MARKAAWNSPSRVLALGVDHSRGKAIAAPQPARAGRLELRRAVDRGITVPALGRAIADDLVHERRRIVHRVADRQDQGRQIGARLKRLKQRVELRESVIAQQF